MGKKGVGLQRRKSVAEKGVLKWRKKGALTASSEKISQIGPSDHKGVLRGLATG